jgi:hypothetical protein
MQGTITQIIALVLYGNRFLTTGEYDDFYPSNSVFNFCRAVTFVRQPSTEGESNELPYASSPQQWFERLCEDGIHGLRVHYTPLNDDKISDRMMVGFVGGGGRWLIEALRDSNSDYWEARWNTTGKKETDDRIWTVTYSQVGSHSRQAEPSCATLGLVTKELKRLLPRVQSFAELHRLDGFARCFLNARKALVASEPLSTVCHSDIAPSGTLRREAQALLAAAQAGWVFGGMGSWNDLGFDGEDQLTYNALSDQLYAALNRAVVEATNTSYSGTA